MTVALQTAAASGIPAGLRKKPALDAKDAKGHAAGVLFVAPDGDVLLLRRSSAEANYAGHWALPGGGVEEGETPAQGADREVGEEMGVKVSGPKKLLDQRMTPTGMAFHTFAQPVAEKFAPKLNGEHSGYAWAPLDQLPNPIHPAVKATLSERVGLANDMTPEAWKGLRDGFIQWTREEEAEAEHATDAAIQLALDRSSVRDKDNEGRLHVAMTNISKATVNPYRGKEIPDSERLGLDPERIYQLLRDPDELEKAAATFNGIQVLKKHVPVSAEDHKPYDVVGTTGTDAMFESPYLKNSLVIWAADAIADIESEAKKELSCGYRYRAEMTPGNFDGMHYDGVMRDIVGNHVALVKDGRAGPDVVVGDSRENLMSKPTRLAAVALRLTARTLIPVMAMDAKLPPLMPLFKDLTSKNFKTKKTEIVAALTKDVKLAKDASLEGVVELLDALENGAAKDNVADESVSEEQHKAMEAAANGESNLGIPKKVGEEFVGKDATEGLKGFLKEKGMGEDDINTAMGMLPKQNGLDENPEEKKKREEEEAKKKAASDAEIAAKAEEEKKAKDAQMKDMVTKPAMDAAITAATEATAKRVRETERGIRAAVAEVRPYVGELAPTLAFDSADDVYRHAAVMLNIPEAKTIHASALPTIIKMQPKPGAQPTQHGPVLGMDAAAVKSVNDRYPGLERISAA